MQRLFSTFPNSWPGCGLFILRLAAAAATLWSAFNAPLAGLSGTVFQSVASVTSTLLVAGLWTPVAGLLQVCIELTDGFGRDSLGFSQFLLSALGLGLAMIGPGAWSLDARLFGRKRIDFSVRKS